MDPAIQGNAGERRDLPGAQPERRGEDKRKQLVEMEYSLQAIELHMASIGRELESLEGFTLTGLLARIKGDRALRIEQAREQWDEIGDKLAKATAAVEALRREVEEIERLRKSERSTGLIGRANPSRDAHSGAAAAPRLGGEAAGGSQKTFGPEEQAKIIQRAIALCEECRKGLLAEIETAGRLGKCNVVAANKMISGLLGATTNRARKEMGQRIRDDLRRLSGRLDEVIASGPSSALPEESDARTKLAHFAEHFDGRWLAPGADGSGTVDAILQTLCLIEMLLEKRLNDATRR